LNGCETATVAAIPTRIKARTISPTKARNLSKSNSVRRLYKSRTAHHIPALMWLSIVIPILLTILVIVCVLLILVVLMQRPKNEGLGAAFGSGVTENIFGAQTATVLTKATVYLGCIFFAVTLLLTVLTAKQSAGRRVGVLESEVGKATPTATTSPIPSASPQASGSAASVSSPEASASAAASVSASASASVSSTAAPSPAASVDSSPAPATGAEKPAPSTKP
jgi:preprotein translocase subunit SecG